MIKGVKFWLIRKLKDWEFYKTTVWI